MENPWGGSGLRLRNLETSPLGAYQAVRRGPGERRGGGPWGLRLSSPRGLAVCPLAAGSHSSVWSSDRIRLSFQKTSEWQLGATWAAATQSRNQRFRQNTLVVASGTTDTESEARTLECGGLVGGQGPRNLLMDWDVRVTERHSRETSGFGLNSCPRWRRLQQEHLGGGKWSLGLHGHIKS